MKNVAYRLALLLWPLIALFPVYGYATNNSFVQAHGRELQHKGEPILLKAICFANDYDKKHNNPLLSKHHTEADFKQVKALGFNSIRFAFNGQWYENDPDSFWEWLDQNIHWAEKQGLLLILDLHVPIGSYWLAPNSPEASFALWEDQQLQQRNIALWEAIAKRYRDEPVIAGYDILNEPVTTDTSGKQWQRLAEQMIAAIRAIDKNHLIIVEKLYGVNSQYGTKDVPSQFLVNDNNVLYDFHFYEPIIYTHQYASWIANPLGDGGRYPDAKYLTPTGKQVLKPELRIQTPTTSIPSDWQAYTSPKIQITDPTVVAAIPLMSIRSGGNGTVQFDNIRVNEYDPKGNWLGEVRSDPLTEQTLWKWWGWQTNPAGVTFTRHNDNGQNDSHSLSISLQAAPENTLAGWSSDHSWLTITTGHYYQISGYMRSIPAKTTGTAPPPKAALELDFYANPTDAPPALLARDSHYLEYELMKYLQFGIDHQVPVSVLETGLVREAFEIPDKGGAYWLRDLLDLFAKHRVSFAWWSYRGDQMGIYPNQQDGNDRPLKPLADALADSLLGQNHPPHLLKEGAPGAKGKKSKKGKLGSKPKARTKKKPAKTTTQPATATPHNPNQRAPSSSPPGGLKPEQVPQFLVIGFDDNILASGLDWAAELFKNRKNPAGNGNPGTYDGTPARTSFYMNTQGLGEWLNDNPITLLSSLKTIKDQQHEIGNHTHNHHVDLKPADWEKFEPIITKLNKKGWQPRIQQCTDELQNRLDLPNGTVSGYRAPFLKYNQSMFSTLIQQGFAYDCSIEEGFEPRFDGTNFRWPYTLHQGSPGHQEGWGGHPDNSNRVTLGSTPGLWELPNHVLMVPDDATCPRYGIQAGLWQRMQQRHPDLLNHRITGFDYNLWVHAGLNKAEFVGILKYNLDLRLQGNRAPMMFGAHTQYYTDPTWAREHAPQVTPQDMQAAMREFIDYALSQPMVRLRPAQDIIAWCKTPSPLTKAGAANLHGQPDFTTIQVASPSLPGKE